ncbi:MAG: hypothetical protein ABIF40_05425 [archaeon]
MGRLAINYGAVGKLLRQYEACNPEQELSHEAVYGIMEDVLPPRPEKVHSREAIRRLGADNLRTVGDIVGYLTDLNEDRID